MESLGFNSRGLPPIEMTTSQTSKTEVQKVVCFDHDDGEGAEMEWVTRDLYECTRCHRQAEVHVEDNVPQAN